MTPALEEMRLLTVREVCEVTSRSRWTIQRLITTGELPHVRFGRSVLIRVGDLRRYIDTNTHGART